MATGTHAVIAILAALRHRDRTGEGQHVDLSLLDVQVSLMANMASNYLATDRAPQRWGNAHPNIVPYQVFQVADGWVIVACGNDLADVFADPQAIARQMRLDLPHPSAGQVSVPASALKLSATPVSYRSAPPLLGQHTDEVLKELTSQTDADLAALKARSIT